MAYTAEDVVKAFEDFFQTAVPYKVVKSKLIERGATRAESATALSDAIHRDLLAVDEVGNVIRVQ